MSLRDGFRMVDHARVRGTLSAGRQAQMMHIFNSNAAIADNSLMGASPFICMTAGILSKLVIETLHWQQVLSYVTKPSIDITGIKRRLT